MLDDEQVENSIIVLNEYDDVDVIIADDEEDEQDVVGEILTEKIELL